MRLETAKIGAERSEFFDDAFHRLCVGYRGLNFAAMANNARVFQQTRNVFRRKFGDFFIIEFGEGLAESFATFQNCEPA